MTRDSDATGSWSDALRRVLFAGNSAGPGRHWADVWRAVLDSRAVRHEIARRSRRALARAPVPGVAAEDVAHDAMLILARQLCRSVHLQANPALAEHFEGWLGTILDRACDEVLRRARRQDRGHAALVDDPPAPRGAIDRDLRIDLAAALASLPDAQRLVATLHLGGHSLTAVAKLLEMSDDKARHLWRAARAALAQSLASYRDNAE